MKVKRIYWQDTLEIRRKVLWPRKSKEFCVVEGDDVAKHYGIFNKNELVGVASVYSDENSVRLRKFAVNRQYQGKGYGSKLLKRILELEKKDSSGNFWCDARESAVSFYEQFGLCIEGDIFYKSDVAYFKMSLNLQT